MYLLRERIGRKQRSVAYIVSAVITASLKALNRKGSVTHKGKRYCYIIIAPSGRSNEY